MIIIIIFIIMIETLFTKVLIDLHIKNEPTFYEK